MTSYDTVSMSSKRAEAVRGFLDTMREGDRAGVVFFTSSAIIGCELTDVKFNVVQSLARITSYGGTNFSKAISKSIELFEKDDSLPINKTIIFLSDGEDSVPYSILKECKRRNIKIYTIGLGNSYDKNLIEIAEQTDGVFYKAYDSKELVDIYAEIGIGNDFDTTDTDGDGLYDAVEAAGIRLQNGKIITECDPNNPDTDGDGLKDGEEINPKPFYSSKTIYNDDGTVNTVEGYYFKMKSDPTLIDTDYDGIDDENDEKPNSNIFLGKLKDTYYEYNVEFSLDYRSFFESKETYQKDLAILGSIFANLAYVNDYLEHNWLTGKEKYKVRHTALTINDGTDLSDAGIKDVFTAFGLEDYEDYKLSEHFDDDDISEMMIGHRKVSYNKKDKEIIFVSVRGTDGTIEEWSSNFDVGADTEDYWDRNNPYWRNKEHHKGFDVAANRLYDQIINYVNANIDNNSDKAIYIVGHSRGAAISNILGTKFENKEGYESYVYTYACPGTTTDTSYKRYKSIFNIVNEDDLVPRLPLDAWGFHKYGTVYSASIVDDYENKFGTSEWYKWESLFDDDYNYNWNVDDTEKSMEEVASSREDLYRFTYDNDTICTYELPYNSDPLGDVEKRETIYGERISRYCEITYRNEYPHTYIDVRQTPAAFTMILADLTASFYHEKEMYEYCDFMLPYQPDHSEEGYVGFKVAEKFQKAKNEFCKSGADSMTGFINIGGMVNGHMPGTYYFLANDYLYKLKAS